MEATTPGQNRTGAALNPKGIASMLDAVRDLSPPVPIDTIEMDVERQSYIAAADSIGSIPPSTARSNGKARKSASVDSASQSILMDKLGERIAFERTGSRLYSALITKHLASINAGEDVLPPAVATETAADTLQRIRAEELEHFHLLCEAVTRLGGDPTAQTPCADVSATASMGLMQVLTDPRTTLAQCLSAILTAELTDNAGWELLIELADQANAGDVAERFSQALEAEEQHVLIIRGWLEVLLTNPSDTRAV